MLEDVSVLSRVGMSSGRLDVDIALRIIPPEPETGADGPEGSSPLELRHVAATEPVSGMLVVAARKLAGRLPYSDRRQRLASGELVQVAGAETSSAEWPAAAFKGAAAVR